jgi:hypothetical protein
MGELVMIVPEKDPGADRYTAIKVHLRLLGAPPSAIPAGHGGLAVLLMWMAKKPTYFGNTGSALPTWIKTNNLYVTHDVFSKTYQIKRSIMK